MLETHDISIPPEVMEALDRQDAALELLERLRAEEPLAKTRSAAGGGRRDFRRWPTPPNVTLEAHDGKHWSRLSCMDMGVGGARLERLPTWFSGPTPVRLKAPGVTGVLVLADIMWRDREGKAGVRFEFHDEEERDLWSGALIDALLARHALAGN
ncbi:MAG: hypothetical protein OHK0029_38430 [Armatimonadaceae bacterium]